MVYLIYLFLNFSMSVDKACQTIMCLWGDSKPNPYPDLSSFNSDILYLSDAALSDCSMELPPLPLITESSDSTLSTDLAAREALAECFKQKLEVANAEGSKTRPHDSKSVSQSGSVATDSLPSRFTVDSGSVQNFM